MVRLQFWRSVRIQLHWHYSLVQLFSLQLWVNSRTDWFFSIGEATSLGEEKLWIQTCQTSLKSWPVSYPARAEGLVNRIIHWFIVEIFVRVLSMVQINLYKGYTCLIEPTLHPTKKLNKQTKKKYKNKNRLRNLLVLLLSAFTRVRLNQLPPEQVTHWGRYFGIWLKEGSQVLLRKTPCLPQIFHRRIERATRSHRLPEQIPPGFSPEPL